MHLQAKHEVNERETKRGSIGNQCREVNSVEQLFEIPEDDPAMLTIADRNLRIEGTEEGSIQRRAARAAIVPLLDLHTLPLRNKRFANDTPNSILHRGLSNTPSIAIRFGYHSHEGEVPRGPFTSPLR